MKRGDKSEFLVRSLTHDYLVPQSEFRQHFLLQVHIANFMSFRLAIYVLLLIRIFFIDVFKII